MDYTREELLEAKKQIVSTVHKLKEVVKTFEAKEMRNAISPRSPWRSAGWPPLHWRGSW